MAKAKTATGAELKAFFAAWPVGDDWYHEDDEGPAKDIENLADDAVLKLEDCGYIAYQGSDPEIAETEVARVGRDFGTEFLRWKRSQTTTLLTVYAPNEKLAEIKKALKALGLEIAQ